MANTAIFRGNVFGVKGLLETKEYIKTNWGCENITIDGDTIFFEGTCKWNARRLIDDEFVNLIKQNGLKANIVSFDIEDFGGDMTQVQVNPDGRVQSESFRISDWS